MSRTDDKQVLMLWACVRETQPGYLDIMIL